ncbi:hypothetical protein [Flaviaesturariibacter terrae]
MEQLPIIIPTVFLLVVLATAILLFRAASSKRTILLGMAAWLILQSAISLSGFYTVFTTLPPRILLLLLPPMALIVVALATAQGRALLDSLDARTLTLLHTVRIPVEGVLWALALYRTVPALITFEGVNFDILSGLSAPLIYYLVFVRKRAGRNALLLWNIACLALLVNVVAHALLSVPTPLQRLSFDQPAIAVGYFPYTLLPGFVVPAVLLAHAAMIRRLLPKEKTSLSYDL